jgi:hypothetical protein
MIDPKKLNTAILNNEKSKLLNILNKNFIVIIIDNNLYFCKLNNKKIYQQSKFQNYR